MEKMMEKIQKLMNVAQKSTNEEEAITAALMAQKLMAKYNITLAQIEESTEEMVEEIIDIKQNSGYCTKWKIGLAQIIANNFRVKTYLYGNSVAFFGYNSDTKIACSVFEYLFSMGNRLSTKYYYKCKSEGKPTKGVMNTWLFGFMSGLRDVLEKQSAELMIITPQEVEDAFAEQSKDFSDAKLKLKINSNDIEAYQDGHAEGRATANSRYIEETA